MVIALIAAVLAAASPVSPLPLAELPPQPLGPSECALVLWERATGRRVAMLLARPGGIRVFSGGSIRNLPEIAADGDAVVGFVPHARFGDAALQVETSLAITASDAAGSAIVRDGAITVTGADRMAVVAPVAGIAGCGG